MFNKPNQQPYAPTGTTSPIYLPRQAATITVKPGEHYFYVKITGAQAAFTGYLWEQVRQLIVTSQVSLNHPVLGLEPMKAIQRSRAVKREQAEQLGLSPNLINPVPATMTHVTISIEFLLDKRNRLADLSSLINEDAFIAAVSLAPGAAMVARTIGGLSQKLMQTFLDSEERQPILQFSGDFNILADDLQDGYYVILGTRDERNPIPSPLPSLTVEHGELLADGRRVTQLSYVILDVHAVSARGRELNDGAVWASKLREAEGVAQRMASDPFAEEPARKGAWEECKGLLKEVQLLLLADPNYLPREASDIIKGAYEFCRSQIFESGSRMVVRGEKGLDSLDDEADRRFLGIDPGENLTETLGRYAEQVAVARRILRQDGML